MTASDAVGVLPFVTLVVGAAAIAMLGPLVRADARTWPSLAAVIAVGAFAVAALAGSGPDALGGLLRRDTAGAYVAALACLGASVLLLFQVRDVPPRTTGACLLATSGTVLATSAGDSVVLAVGIALIGSATFAVSADHERRGERRLRAALPAALVALGAILEFADVGSTRIGALGGASSSLGTVAIGAMAAGLLTCAAVIPFDGLAPRVSSRAPALAVTLVGLVARIAGFAALLRIAAAISASGAFVPEWRASIAIVAAITVVVASVAALTETSLRRVLGWLTMAQAGYVATALTAGIAAGTAVAFALATSAALVIGGVALLATLGDAQLGDLRGLARRRPYVVAALALVLLGAAGVPPTVGFIARVYVFEIALGAQLAWLVILGSLASVVQTVAALRVVFACLGEGESPPAGTRATRMALAVAAAVVLLVGIFPAPLLDAVANVSF
jgi:NADH-quinone oxidoreductase subunit N